MFWCVVIDLVGERVVGECFNTVCPSMCPGVCVCRSIFVSEIGIM